MRWTEDEYKRFVRHGPGGQVTEAAWQSAVVKLLRQHGYAMIYHTYDSRRSPSGFMDLVCAHAMPGHPLLAIELKTDTGQVTPAQAAWLAALAGCTEVIPAVWRPKDLEDIVRLLQQG